jgi:hypothetical protein
LRNLNKSVVEVPVEYMHRLLAAIGEHLSGTDASAVDTVIGEIGPWATADEFVKLHGDLFAMNKEGTYTMVEHDTKKFAPEIEQFSSALVALFAEIAKAPPPKLSPTDASLVINSYVFESYSVRFLGGDEWLNQKHPHAPKKAAKK